MALNFPNSPTNGQLYTDALSGNSWTWDSANTCWKSTSTYIQTITVASSAPGTPAIGQLWWNRDYGRLLVYYSDGDTSQWVDASPSDYTSALAFNKANNALANTTSTFNGALTLTGGITANGSIIATPSANAYVALDNNGGYPRLDFYNQTPVNILGYIQSDGLVINGAAGVERMRINSSGYVTTPYQPFFTGFVSDGGSWRNFNTVATLVKMTYLTVNQGNFYNSSTGFFTCPVAGIYKVSVWALMGQAGGSNYVYVYKNASNVSGNGAHVNTNGYSLWVAAGLTVFVSCAANDTLSMYGWTDNKAGFYTSDSHTGMTIELAG